MDSEKSGASPHQKHVKLIRSVKGEWGRQEWAVLGTTCGRIEALALDLAKALKGAHQMGFLDVRHSSGGMESTGSPFKRWLTTLPSGDYQVQHTRSEAAYSFRQQLVTCDWVLVNGHHFEAKRQWVVMDERKRDSVQRRLQQLAQVELFLMPEGQEEPWDFLKDHLPDWESIPALPLEDIGAIAEWVDKKVARPGLRGLVLAGGKSSRMGEDKGAIVYHDKPQREYTAERLRSFCGSVHLSVRPEQGVSSTFPLLPDTFTNLGPMGAILSAFRHDPEAAWLVVACDLPKLSEQSLSQLVEGRDPSRLATAFRSPWNPFPEPLITIWEPRAYPVMLQWLAQGYSCPRKVLINEAIRILQPRFPEELQNVNTPEERAGIDKGA